MSELKPGDRECIDLMNRIGQYNANRAARARGRAVCMVQLEGLHPVVLTQQQLDILISLTEMTLEGSGCAFGDWLTSNPEEVGPLEALNELLCSLDPTGKSEPTSPGPEEETPA